MSLSCLSRYQTNVMWPSWIILLRIKPFKQIIHLDLRMNLNSSEQDRISTFIPVKCIEAFQKQASKLLVENLSVSICRFKDFIPEFWHSDALNALWLVVLPWQQTLGHCVSELRPSTEVLFSRQTKDQLGLSQVTKICLSSQNYCSCWTVHCCNWIFFLSSTIVVCCYPGMWMKLICSEIPV